MDYTKQETKYLEKRIRFLEKDKRNWPWLRWIILLASVSLMGIALYLFNLLTHLQETLSSLFAMPEKEVDSEMVKHFVDGQLTSLRLEFIILFKVAFYEIFGAVLLVYCLKNWNRHIKNGIMIKFINDLLSKKRQ